MDVRGSPDVMYGLMYGRVFVMVCLAFDGIVALKVLSVILISTVQQTCPDGHDTA